MLTSWQKQIIEELVEKVTNFYHDSSKGYFSGTNKIEEFNIEQRNYFNSLLSLSKFVGAEESIILNSILEQGKFGFAVYILRSGAFDIEVNSVTNYKSCFQLLVEQSNSLNGSDWNGYFFEALYKKGYSTKESDMLYIKEAYKSIDSQNKLVEWCIARFVLILNEKDMIAEALKRQKELLTIVSFKMKKPVGIHYPNLLGISNNAFLHYRIHGDVLLHAMKYYGIYEDVIKKDHKNSFQYRLNEFLEYKPIQDLAFNEIVFKIFPELKY